MRTTEILFAVLILGILSYLAGPSIADPSMIDKLGLVDPNKWLGAGMFMALAFGVITSGFGFFAGGGWKYAATAGLIGALFGIATFPATQILQYPNIPIAIKWLLAGTYIYLFVSAIGSAMRGDL